MPLVLRRNKGAPLTYEEMDGNFEFLDNKPSGGSTELRIDGGNSSTVFNNYLLRMDFGIGGASINPEGNPSA